MIWLITTVIAVFFTVQSIMAVESESSPLASNEPFIGEPAPPGDYTGDPIYAIWGNTAKYGVPSDFFEMDPVVPIVVEVIEMAQNGTLPPSGKWEKWGHTHAANYEEGLQLVDIDRQMHEHQCPIVKYEGEYYQITLFIEIDPDDDVTGVFLGPAFIFDAAVVGGWFVLGAVVYRQRKTKPDSLS